MRTSISVALLAAVGVVIGGAAEPARALTLENPSTIIAQQADQSPCVIGDPSCHQPAGFDFTVLAPNQDTHDVFSPIYTVEQIIDIATAVFSIGIDTNTANGQSPEVLDFFAILVDGTEISSYTGPTDLLTVNNGTGFSDARLLGFDLTGFALTSTVQFHLTYHDATNGRENFFLISGAAIPEPATMALLCSGLLGAMGARRRRR